MKRIVFSALAHLGFTCLLFGQAPPQQAAGYKLLFSEDFSSFDLSSNGYGKHAWYPGIYYQPVQPPSSLITSNNSILDLQWERSNGQTNTSIEGCSYDATYCNAYRYGYFEARMKWDVTTGDWPAFWMITKQSILGIQHVGELDIFEGQGNDPTHYYGTINEWNGPSQILTTNSTNGKNRYALPSGNDFSQWHTYGLLWVPGKVTWYYDNQPVGSASTPTVFDEQDFFIILGSQEGNNWIGGNLSGVTAQAMNLDVEWVHVFQGPDSPPETVVRALAIVTPTLPAPNSALPYAVKPLATGGEPPYKFAISAGALPVGLQLDAPSGTISSIPGKTLASGSYSFTLQVTDTGGATATQAYSGAVPTGQIVSTFGSYALPTNGSGANGITVGPDGALWFTTLDQTGGNLIGRITTAGVVDTAESIHPLTKGNAELTAGGDIAMGPNGQLWMAERDGNVIGEIPTSMSSQAAYAPGTSNSAPAQITASPDGALWFTEAAASKIAHVNVSGNLVELPTLTGSSSPLGIAVAPDKSVWFTELAANKIGYVSEDGTTKAEFAIPTANSLPTSIVFGPDNAFYFAEYGAKKIGRIDLNGNIQEAAVSSAPHAIAVGPDAALYFTETSGNKIGRMTILGTVNEFPVSDANSGPTGIVTGPDGSIWFTENNLSKIGRLSFIQAPTVTCTFPSGALQTGEKFSGSCAGSHGTAPYTFGAAATPPSGLSLNPNTGRISGTLTTPGTFTFTMVISDSSSPIHTGQQTYTLKVAGSAVSPTSATSPAQPK